MASSGTCLRPLFTSPESRAQHCLHDMPRSKLSLRPLHGLPCPTQTPAMDRTAPLAATLTRPTVKDTAPLRSWLWLSLCSKGLSASVHLSQGHGLCLREASSRLAPAQTPVLSSPWPHPPSHQQPSPTVLLLACFLHSLFPPSPTGTRCHCSRGMAGLNTRGYNQHRESAQQTPLRDQWAGCGRKLIQTGRPCGLRKSSCYEGGVSS